MSIAVMMTAHRRPAYLKRTLAAWAKADGIGDVVEFLISLDASDRTDQMLKALRDFHALSPKFTVKVNDPPLGVSRNPVESGTQLLDAHPEAQFLVLAEEDILPARDTLAWLSWCARSFAGQPKVLCACAHQRLEGTDPAASAVSTDFAPWIWGTWRDRWSGVLEPTWDRNYYTWDAEFPSCGFDWNISHRIIPRGGYCTILPGQSRSQNIGQYDGVHAAPERWAETQVKSFRADQEPVAYRLDQ